MKLLMQPARKAESVRRGLAAFFVAAGLLAVYASTSVLTLTVALMLGLPSITLGIGIWRYWGLARWAALGTCFLMVISAFALPLIVRVPISVGEFANPARVEYMSWGFAGALGLLGFWGLQYFRSPASKADFARSADMRAAFEAESSSVVVTSALFMFGFWLVPVGVVWSEQSHPTASRPAGSARRPAQSSQFEVESPANTSARPVPSSDLAENPPRDSGPQDPAPDLVITGLCRRGDSMVQAEIANRGQSGSNRNYSITYSSLRVGGGGGGVSWGRVPPPGTSGLVGLDRAINPFDTENEGLDVRLSIDSGNHVRESDEANNKAVFPIVFRFYLPDNLPRCPKLPEMNGR